MTRGGAYQLLALDLDGTILDDTLALAPALVAAVRRASARGLRVTLATGRMPLASRRYWEELGITAPVILYNGALVRDPQGGTDLAAWTLPPGLAWTVAPVYTNAPVHPLFFSGDSIFCLEKTYPIVRYCQEQGLEASVIARPDVFLAHAELAKCLFMAHPDALGIVREELTPLIAPDARLVLSRPDYLELLPAAASKGVALRWVAGHLGIDMASTIAVGDQENDLEMIRAAGIGVAMSHAPAHVRGEARRVAPPPEAGGLLALLAELSPPHFQ